MSTTTQSTDVFDRFAHEYQQFHGMSEARRVRQLKELRAFADHAGKDILDCSGTDLGAYLADLVGRGLHVNTVRKRGNYIRPFYSFAYEKDLITGERLMAIRAVKNPKGSSGRATPKPYSSKELSRWRRDLDERYPLLPDYRLSYFLSGRSKYSRGATHVQRVQIEAIVSLALYCGLRRKEIFDLTIDDMHPDNAYVVVRSGKGGKPREVPHTKHSRAKIEEWLKLREWMNPPHDQPWLSCSPYQKEDGWLRPIRWKRFELLLTTVGNYQFHRFRHTAATNWLRAGMPLEVVSRLLGHANVTQTLGYAEIVRDDIVAQVEKLEDTFERQINGYNMKEDV